MYIYFSFTGILKGGALKGGITKLLYAEQIYIPVVDLSFSGILERWCIWNTLSQVTHTLPQTHTHTRTHARTHARTYSMPCNQNSVINNQQQLTIINQHPKIRFHVTTQYTAKSTKKKIPTPIMA